MAWNIFRGIMVIIIGGLMYFADTGEELPSYMLSGGECEAP